MMTSFDGKILGKSVCEGIDLDGDKRLRLLSFEGNKFTPTEVSGTGKYEGMEESGDFVRTPFPTIKPGTFQACVRQTGTYKLK
jgi:hypothetical protein